MQAVGALALLSTISVTSRKAAYVRHFTGGADTARPGQCWPVRPAARVYTESLGSAEGASSARRGAGSCRVPQGPDDGPGRAESVLGDTKSGGREKNGNVCLEDRKEKQKDVTMWQRVII